MLNCLIHMHQPDLRHYFRTHCRYVASSRPRRRPRRSRTSLLASISAPVNAFRHREVVPPRKSAKPTPIDHDESARRSVEGCASVGWPSTTSQEHSYDGPSKWLESSRDRDSSRVSSPQPMNATASEPVPFPSSDGHDGDLSRAHTTSPIFLRQRRVLTFRGAFQVLPISSPLFISVRGRVTSFPTLSKFANNARRTPSLRSR